MLVFPIAGNNFPTTGSRDIHTNIHIAHSGVKGLNNNTLSHMISHSHSLSNRGWTGLLKMPSFYLPESACTPSLHLPCNLPGPPPMTLFSKVVFVSLAADGSGIVIQAPRILIQAQVVRLLLQSPGSWQLLIAESAFAYPRRSTQQNKTNQRCRSRKAIPQPQHHVCKEAISVIRMDGIGRLPHESCECGSWWGYET